MFRIIGNYAGAIAPLMGPILSNFADVCHAIQSVRDQNRMATVELDSIKPQFDSDD